MKGHDTAHGWSDFPTLMVFLRPSPMPMMTKAATPFRMPRYLTPNTTWYRNRAIKQLSPMLLSPKRVRNTAEEETTHWEMNRRADTRRVSATESGCCTGEGGEDVDQQRDTGSADERQHHVIVERVSHFVVKQLRSPIEHLHLAETGPRRVSHGGEEGRWSWLHDAHLVDCSARTSAY